MQGYENRWPILRADVMSGLSQPAEQFWLVSARPGTGRVAGVIGGSGVLDGIGGRYGEYLQPGAGGDINYTGQIRLELSFR
jgi:hypothetical protein